MSLSATVGMAIDADRKGCLQSDAIHFRGLDERNGPEAFWVTPRRPEPRDFHSLSQHHDRAKAASGLGHLHSSVVHEAGQLDPDHQSVLDWLSGLTGTGLATLATCSV